METKDSGIEQGSGIANESTALDRQGSANANECKARNREMKQQGSGKANRKKIWNRTRLWNAMNTRSWIEQARNCE